MDLTLTDYNYHDYLFMASITCSAKRYREAYPLIVKLIEHETTYSEELVDLIQSCFKNILTPLRDSISIIDSLVDKIEQVNHYGINLSNMKNHLISQMKHYIEFKDRIDIKIQYSRKLDDSAYVLLKRLKADFCRYSYEIGEYSEGIKELDKADEAYSQAYEFAIKNFKPISEEVLCTVLNYSVFIDKYKKNRPKALDLATTSYMKAQNYLERYDKELYDKPAKLIKLLQQNIIVWQKSDNHK